MTIAAHHHDGDLSSDPGLAAQQAKAPDPGRVIAAGPPSAKATPRLCWQAGQLRRAFDNGELLLHYQPVVRLGDGGMIGAEALLRWNHPSEGLVAPAAFLPVLDRSGLIVEIGSWAIREAVRQVESWHVLYGRDIVNWVSVNLSARQFDDPSRLLATVRTIDECGFSMHRLGLEIAEGALMRNPEITRAALAELHELGLRLAIDDFGTGYSSLESLRHYPVNTIKIDAEFIAQIGNAEGDKLLQALLNIVHAHGAAIIAEGIETAAQCDFLLGNGCGLGQGYLFAEPMDGALLGAYALTHAVKADRGPNRTRLTG